MSRSDTAHRHSNEPHSQHSTAHPEGSPDAPSNLQKDPDDWITGDERMTDAQASYLKTLSDEAHEPFDPRLTKAEASKRIEALQQRTGRGHPASDTSR